MPTPPLRHDFVNFTTPGANDLIATEYNLNATRTDAAFDTATTATTAAAAAQSTADIATTALALKAPLASPAFTGTPTGITKAHVGLGNVDNTSDTAKRTPRIGGTASAATPSIDCTLVDQYNITALAVAITSVIVTGTAVDGQVLYIRFKDNGTIRAVTLGASFVAGPAALLTTTAAGKTHLTAYKYDSAAAKWACILVHVAGY